MSEGVTQNGKPASPLDMGGAKPVGVEVRRQIREPSRGVIACASKKWLSQAAEKSFVALSARRPYRKPTLVDG